MVEKIWYCPKGHYVPQNIPYEEQPRICPKCGTFCKEGDFVDNEKDVKAWMEDNKQDNKGVTSFKPDKKDD